MPGLVAGLARTKCFQIHRRSFLIKILFNQLFIIKLEEF